MKRLYKMLFLLLIIPWLGFSAENYFNYSKQKKINKAYIVNPDATLAIENSYGTISVTTWNEDKIELAITIKVSGDNEKWVNQKINDIDVEISALKAIISATTIFGNSSYQNQSRNTSFEINYSLKIPKNGHVKLSNKYGNIITNDLYGHAEIKCKYGKVISGKLWNDSTIQMDYCSNSTITFIKKGTINAKYSNLKIIDAGNLDLISDYTDVEILNCDNLKYNSKYGKIRVNNIKTLDASGNYLTIHLGEVYETLKLSTKYSSLKIDVIKASANKVSINSSYTGINIGFDPNFTFNFDILLRYANFKYNSELDFFSKEVVSNSKKYTGFYKKKDNNYLTIVSDYGNVTLTKNQ
ncbi:hypothetical protein RCH18_002516 [Flavobacterium sp. PL11]|uniref:hypothetical protein n=1 Tax=Flavobacterium sp. PL11 TaxID=3071717 RepID=UPI002DFF81A7|nr:hypothetical protein [Flavobacterium sp. PL11]